MNNIKIWYLSKSQGDQRILNVLGILVALLLIYALLINPLQKELSNRKTRVSAQEKTLAWMHSAAATVQSLSGGQSRSAASNNKKAPYILADEAIQKRRLPTPSRIEPAGKKGVRLQYQSVDFDRLMLLLDDLQSKYQLHVTSLNIARKEMGKVSARITLEGLS